MTGIYEATYRLERVNADLNFGLVVFGDRLAQREGYKEHKGVEAIQFYLVQKHNWLPSQVKAMSPEDLRFCVAEEMSGWTLPAEAINAMDNQDR
ncbi:MAG: hypothetical protein JJ866_13005 [Roseibium sp.]|uniref:hypothetical protein n=1 Tax=Roseibium sp. TaxID=1936156 RepID=UPI001B1A4473|nr:hypothetical protein [Roseibium sp.]MBO6892854.1 hypothetical protein [Roseibium sp.]MBO6927955.1 hypothetical protein [Roseibium sp.]